MMIKNLMLEEMSNKIRDNFFISDHFVLTRIAYSEITFHYKYNKNIKLTIYNTMSNTRYVLAYSFNETDVSNNKRKKVLKDLLNVVFYTDKDKFFINNSIFNMDQKNNLKIGIMFDIEDRISLSEYYIKHSIFNILKSNFVEYDLKILKEFSILIYERNLYTSEFQKVELKSRVLNILNKESIKDTKELIELNFKL